MSDESTGPDSPEPSGEARAEARYLECSLEDALGGEHGPDLTQRILGRAIQEGLVASNQDATHPQSVSPKHPMARPDVAPGPRARGRALRRLAAAALLTFGTGWLLGESLGSGADAPPPDGMVRVAAGTPVLHAQRLAGQPITEQPKGAVGVPMLPLGVQPLAVGDVLLSGSEQPATVSVAPYGTLALTAGGAVEIDEAFAMSDSGKLVVGSVVLAVVTGGLGYTLGSSTGEAQAGDRVVLEAPEQEQQEQSPVVGELEATIAEQKARIAALEEALDANREVAEAEPIPEEPEPEEEPFVALVSNEQYAELLDKIDWQKVGESMHQMGPLLTQLAAAMAAGEEIDMELMGRIGELNGALVRMATQADAAGLPGFSVNGSFTHPLMMGNSVAATLKAGGVSLSDAQAARLQGLVELYSREDESLRMAAPGHESKVQTILEEAAYKDRFFQELDGILSPDQLAVIRPDGKGAGTVGLDLFSTGLIWQDPRTFNRIPATGPEDLANQGTSRFMATLGVSADRKAVIRGAVDRWVQSLPADFWENGPKANGQVIDKSVPAAAAKRQLSLIRDIISSGALTPAQVEKLRTNPGVFVPMVVGK